MNYAIISYGGLGDLVLHIDALRQALRFLPPPRACYATRAAAELGQMLMPGLDWRSVPPRDEAHDAFVELRWFTTVLSADENLSRALVPDRIRYNAFEVARAEGAVALAHCFAGGLSMRAVLCRSWGFVEDDDFVALDVKTNARCLQPYVVIANDAERPWPVRDQQTKQLPRELLVEIVAAVARRLAAVHIIEVGEAKRAPGLPGTLDLRGATTIADLLGILAGASVVMCIEGGVAHLCAALRKRAIVLTGPTAAVHYGHSAHVYLRSGICSPCAWSVIDWYAHCPQHLNAACMSGFDPENIAARVVDEMAIGHTRQRRAEFSQIHCDPPEPCAETDKLTGFGANFSTPM